jgi:HK97 family phage major capsid protein
MPGITLVDVLRQSVDELHGRMDAIEAGAVADQRDTLTDVEQATWDELRAEAEAKTARLELLVSRGELDAQAGALVARIRGAAEAGPTPDPLAGPSSFPYRTPGEYVLGYMRARHGDAAESARFTRALADVTTAGTPGLVPPQVTGDVLGSWVGNRPSVDAMSHPTLPPVGMEVQRPHISQHTDVGPHTEKGPVTSREFKLDLAKIPLSSYAGAVDVSWELANRSSPSALDIVFQDLAAVYGRNSDKAAMNGITANIAQAVVWDGTAATLAKAIADAAVLCATNGEENLFPDTVWLGLSSYGLLASLVDAAGRPLFPYLAPMNAYGTGDAVGNLSSVMGLRPVVDPYITPNTFVVGPADQAEFYETPGAPVQLSVVDVGVAGYNIGVIGMWAAAAVDPAQFARITSTALPLAAGEEGDTSSGTAHKANAGAGK